MSRLKTILQAQIESVGHLDASSSTTRNTPSLADSGTSSFAGTSSKGMSISSHSSISQRRSMSSMNMSIVGIFTCAVDGQTC